MDSELPPGVTWVRTTEVFDQHRHPAGFRRAHRVADGVWGRLVVQSGTLGFVFEDEPEHIRRVRAGQAQIIPPGRLHHVEFVGPVTFAVEFYRA